MEIIFPALVIIFLVIGVAAWANSKARERARQDYHCLLAMLKMNPYDPNLRQATLAKGRFYSDLTRNSQGVTVYDEMAIMNDLGAATAGAATAGFAASPIASHRIHEQLEDRLGKLGKLFVSGLIAQDEHDARRQEILKEI